MEVSRSMSRPLSGAWYEKGAYWEGLGSGTGLPAWAFDFIGVHNSRLHLGLRPEFSLSAPMCVVESLGMRRPEWEHHFFKTHKAALRFACKLGERLGVFVVDCVEKSA